MKYFNGMKINKSKHKKSIIPEGWSMQDVKIRVFDDDGKPVMKTFKLCMPDTIKRDAN